MFICRFVLLALWVLGGCTTSTDNPAQKADAGPCKPATQCPMTAQNQPYDPCLGLSAVLADLCASDAALLSFSASQCERRILLSASSDTYTNLDVMYEGTTRRPIGWATFGEGHLIECFGDISCTTPTPIARDALCAMADGG